MSLHRPTWERSKEYIAQEVARAFEADQDVAAIDVIRSLKMPREKSSKASKFRSEKRKAKRATKAEKNEETARIRKAVFVRAGDLCERCKDRPPSEMHHVFGRVRVSQAATNCLALCHWCHDEFTNPKRSALLWERVVQIFMGYGFAHSAAMAAKYREKALDREAANERLASSRERSEVGT